MVRRSTEEAEPFVDDGLGIENASKSRLHLFMLTLSLGGLQVVWSVQHSCMSPYLLSLGMSKALLAITWVAGPLTGAIVQPYIGIRSDNCRSRWGRRKPFMVAGGGMTVICLLNLAWLREIVGVLAGLVGIDAESDGVKGVVILGAMVLIYCLDFAINTVQAGIRAFIVDNAPWHQQESAAAWASRVNGAGSILGYALGFMNLPQALPIFGDSQMKVLCVIASLSLGTTLLISCTYITESTPPTNSNPNPKTSKRLTLLSQIRSILNSAMHTPPLTRQVFAIQFFSWLGWFPFLFYATTYIGQLYVDPIFEENRDLESDRVDEVWMDAVRIGAFALFWQAVVSFGGNVALPFLVSSGDQHSLYSTRNMSTSTGTTRASQSRLTHLFGIARRVLAEPHLLQIPGLTLRRLWLASNVLFALCMFSTLVISSSTGASVMTGFIGISWAVTQWVPYAIISTEVARVDTPEPSSGGPGIELDSRIEEGADTSDNDSPSISPFPRLSEDNHADTGIGATSQNQPQTQAGTVLGLHNVFISVPQIVSSLIGSVIFAILQKPRGEAHDTSVAWVMRFGGVAALGAAYLTVKLRE